MATTFTLISSTTLSGSQATVTFSSIPSTYTDLCLKVSAKTDGTSTYGSYSTYIEFNSNASSLYSTTGLWVTWDGSVNYIASNNSSAKAYIWAEYTAESNTPTSVFGNMEIYIPSYTASQSKPLNVFSVNEKNAAPIEGINTSAGLYRSNTAISSIKIKPAGSIQWVSGSTFYLYGIKNS